MNQSNERPPASNPPPAARLAKKTISSEAILEGEREVWIRHGATIYRLCETKTGKLILQK